MGFVTINPATEEIIAHYEELKASEIESKILSCSSAQKHWQATSFAHRSELMRKAADVLTAGKNEYAKIMALEMGKPLAQGIAEAEKCARVCLYYAENAEQHLADEQIATEMKKSYVAYRPLGVVLAIMPWNFPFWQVFRFAAPALMAGNGGLLKHARNTMGCAIMIEDVFRKAGFPDGIFTNLVIGSSPVAGIISHPEVAAVTLTGSTPVGQSVAETAGRNLKKTVLELGGSDPYIILEDADIEKAAQSCAVGRLINSGQSCIAAKRFIVVRSVLGQFEEAFSMSMAKYKMGDPFDSEVYVGPQARKDLQEDLIRQVSGSIEKGARLLLGGNVPDTKGYYYPPTILTDVSKGMEVYDEETFGPVAAIIPAENEQEAIEIANDTIFGLGACVYTRDEAKGERIAKYELNAGCCFVNDYVRSDPRLPFGGVKQSGYGRELAMHGIREFMNAKTVVAF